MSYTKSTPSLDDLEPGLYYRNLPLRTEPLHKSAKSLMAVYEKDEYGEWSTYRGRGIPDCDAEAVALHHLAEYHERGGLFRLSFSATPTNGVGSRTTYTKGQRVRVKDDVWDLAGRGRRASRTVALPRRAALRGLLRPNAGPGDRFQREPDGRGCRLRH